MTLIERLEAGEEIYFTLGPRDMDSTVYKAKLVEDAPTPYVRVKWGGMQCPDGVDYPLRMALKYVESGTWVLQ